ncbi:carotenoid oxygenase family protein [Ktedonosporobacter rubrisoli]|uniref:Carotenoid oxygenase family protein n=1 Tax=Ktedonosporobacter rubrisoli TaxID=2509675 RepID=A0A4V0YY91_KTERU|nr:carotenoid oxygenase family protein [Ktedonosporobacter rubrisoli]QBD75401.1 carotenoid oxygenase family protein [Ktedonosporobacter rubrisoli]
MSNIQSPQYASLDEEIVLDQLPITGNIPTWLSGSLLRNGPAKFEVGADSFNHLFEGFAMLHRFSFHDGRVSYANKFLQSTQYTTSLQEGKITFAGFAADPCKRVFKGAFTEMIPNANVSINKLAEDFVAMTEIPLPVKFDPRTLDTLGVVHYDDQITGQHDSAHPHFDFARRMSISYITEYGLESRFKVYSIRAGEHSRRLIGSYPVAEPAYIHSFGLSENYVIIAEYPYRVNPRQLDGSRPFIENFTWRPQEGAFFVIMDKQDGRVVGRYPTEAFFTFHHANAFEQDGSLLVDLVAYPSPTPMSRDLYLEQLRTNRRDSSLDDAELRRYRIPLDGVRPVTYEVLSNYTLEMPTINYKRCNTHDYGAVYGIGGSREPGEIAGTLLLRVDVRERMTTAWGQDGCYPGEPVFVEAPDAADEDDGVILSVVLDMHKGRSFLLILDARTFQEIGRAEVPHHIPEGFHGQFFHDVQVP